MKDDIKLKTDSVSINSLIPKLIKTFLLFSSFVQSLSFFINIIKIILKISNKKEYINIIISDNFFSL
jgi:hypothetical protein